MKNFSLDLYRTFWAVGKSGSLTKAASILFVTQPSVSFALKSLEEQLGAILCVRSQKGISLTAEGQVLFEELNRAFEHIEVAERKIKSLLDLDSGKISISAGDTVCNSFLIPLMTAFTEKYPSVSFEITNRTSPETLELIRSRKAEIGFVNIYPDDSFLASKCMDLTPVLISGKKYGHLSRKIIPIAALLEYPLIMLERKSNSRIQLDSFFESVGIQPCPIYELGSIDLILSFVKNNHGLTFIHKELCGHLIDNEILFHIQTNIGFPKSELLMIELKDVPISHASQRFKSFVLER